jgi:hypothetical protein
MGWNALTFEGLRRCRGLIASGALLLAGVGLIVPMIGLVAGVKAALAAASSC